jgi:Tfp pilus assembly protein PilV
MKSAYPPRARRPAGFCLLENLVALAIVTLSLLGTGRVFGEALSAMRYNADVQTATMLGQDILDRLTALDASVAAGTSLRCTVTASRCFDDPPLQSAIGAWRSVLVREMPRARAEIFASGTQTTRVFRVRIDWPTRRAGTASQEFERVLTQ